MLSSVTGTVSGIPTDWLIIASILILFIVFSVVRGTTYATALSLSLPISLLLYQSISKGAFIGGIAAGFSSPIAQSVLFLIIAALLFVLTNQAIASFDTPSSVVSGIAAGLAALIVLVVIWMQIPVLQSLWHFTVQLESVFAGAYAFWWLIAAYVLLAFSRR